MFSKIKNYIKTHKYVLLLLYWPIHTLWYELLRISLADRELMLISCELDSKIPFCEWFIIPYVMWYPFIALILLYSLKQSKRDFLRSSALLTLTMLLPMIFCTIVPNGIPLSLQPDFETLGRDNFLISLVKLMYATDFPPTSVMPSMHVAVSVAAFAAVLQLKQKKHRIFSVVGSGILSVLIILSTVFIKQHSVLDVLFGIITGLFVIFAVFITEKLYDRKKAKKQKETQN